MKLQLLAVSFLLTAIPAMAEYRVWTNSEGVEAELDLYDKEEKDGEVVGVFRTKSGKTTRIKASQLSDQDARILKSFVPGGGPSVFDDALAGNLLQLDGGKLQPMDGFKKPSKYYLFYYTASWCGPCQRFTPSLVKFYNEKKSDQFEIVLISSDRDKGAMEKYAVGKKMTWPHLKLSEARKFKGQFGHPGRGIPNLVLCDPKGKIIKSSYEGNKYIGPYAVMQHLDGLLD